MRGFRSRPATKWLAVGMVTVGAVLIVVSWRLMLGQRATLIVTQVPLPMATEPLIPTRTPTPQTQVGPSPQLEPSPPRSTAVVLPTGQPTGTPSPVGVPESSKQAEAATTPTSIPSPHPTEGAKATAIPASPTPTPSPTEVIEYLPLRVRFGVGVAIPSIEAPDPTGQLGAGWYLNWQTGLHPPRPKGMEFAQMIRLKGGSYNPDLDTIGAVADANPGSLWLIGNEPDVKWQDNATPEEYARVYHELYTFLKGRDPTCQVAIGGVSQPTPLRLQYLDMILEIYEQLYGERMPVDVWNVHAFILREERDSWGIDIPPGLSAASGALYEVEDHDDLGIFAQQIVAFRRWMREKEEGNKPLIVSEYGILMPEDYGFSFERVRDFMYGTFNYFLSAADEELGYPPDDNRLVQRWAWYSLSDRRYPTGNLIDPDTKEFTPLGLAYKAFVGEGD